MTRRGRPVLGAVAGMFFGLFLGMALLAFGVLGLDAVVLAILPVALLVLGIGWGLRAPLGGRS